LAAIAYISAIFACPAGCKIAPDKSQIYFFEKQKDSLDAVLRPINIDKDGKLSDWPKSFFDEWDNQLDKLLW
jgi:predicted ATPase